MGRAQTYGGGQKSNLPSDLLKDVENLRQKQAN